MFEKEKKKIKAMSYREIKSMGVKVTVIVGAIFVGLTLGAMLGLT